MVVCVVADAESPIKPSIGFGSTSQRVVGPFSMFLRPIGAPSTSLSICNALRSFRLALAINLVGNASHLIRD